MNYLIQPANASLVESKNKRVKESANEAFRPSGIWPIKSENIDMSENSDGFLRDLPWILPLPVFPPLDNKETANPSSLQLDELTWNTSHISIKQPSINSPVNQGLSFQEKSPIPTPPILSINCDSKTTDYRTVSKPYLLRTSMVHLPQEYLVHSSPSIRPEASLVKDIDRPKTEVSKPSFL